MQSIPRSAKFEPVPSFLLLFIILKITWGRQLVQPILPEYQFLHRATAAVLRIPEGENNSETESLFSIYTRGHCLTNNDSHRCS